MLLHNLYYPPDTGSEGAIEDKALSKDDMIEFMDEETPDETLELEKDKKIDAKKSDEGDDEKEKDGEKKDEIKELEEELEIEEKTEDELELVVPTRKKEILAKYPTLFKDFPYLEKAYYREQKYAELLPTIADAETAIEKANLLDQFETQLSEGSTLEILKNVKKNDEDAFLRIVDNYLPNLEAVSPDAYYHIVGNIIKHTIATMVGEKDDDLTIAAQVLNKYIFGKDKYEPPTRLSKAETKEKNSREEEISERERAFNERQFKTVQSDLNTRVNNILKSTIDKNIDPKSTMTDYVRKHATSEAMDNLEELVSQDTRFMNLLDKLWERAIKNNMDSDSVDKIRSAYLSKSKTLLQSVIKKARNDALRGLGKRVTDDNDDTKDRKGHLPVGNTRSSTSSLNSGKTDKDKARAIPKGMSSLDYLNQD